MPPKQFITVLTDALKITKRSIAISKDDNGYRIYCNICIKTKIEMDWPRA